MLLGYCDVFDASIDLGETNYAHFASLAKRLGCAPVGEDAASCVELEIMSDGLFHFALCIWLMFLLLK